MKPQELFIQYEKEVAQFKLALIKRLTGETVPSVPTAKKRTSKLSMIEAVLRAADKPLHRIFPHQSKHPPAKPGGFQSREPLEAGFQKIIRPPLVVILRSKMLVGPSGCLRLPDSLCSWQSFLHLRRLSKQSSRVPKSSYP